MMIFGNGKPNFQNANHVIAFDGNSLVLGEGATSTQDLATKVHALPILSSSSIPVRSYGISGQTIANMTSGLTDINAAYNVSKRNILIIWEGTNSIFFGRTGAQALTDLSAYTTAVNTGKSWEIYIITVLPRRDSRGSFSVSQLNTYIDDFNTGVKNNFKAYGLAGVIDIRQSGSPFALTAYNTSDFATANAYWATGEKSTDAFSVHLNSAGYDVIAQYVAQKLRGIGVR